MSPRLIILFLISLLCSASISRASLYADVNDALKPCAEKLRNKEYAAAREAALSAPISPARDFVLGVASYRLEKWDDASRFLSSTADTFSLLGDFSLYYRANALLKLSRFDEALSLLQRLRKEYPESPLIRSAGILHADTLFHKADFKSALDSYQSFVETYSSGNDSIKARYHAALCREKLGDRNRAAGELRGIWLNYPGNAIAAEAEVDLSRLRSERVAIEPYSSEEILKRGIALYDMRKYREALAVFAMISESSLSEQLRTKLIFKSAMSQYRLKKNREAERTFSRIASLDPAGGEFGAESSYWLAQILDRNGRKKEAANAFLRLAQARPRSQIAPEALFQAAYLMKHMGRHHESLVILKKLANDYPSATIVSRVHWESAWDHYFTGGYQAAAESFRRLAADPAYREKALYWQGRSLDSSGSRDAALKVYAALISDYPAGFYTMNILKTTGNNGCAIPSLSRTPLASLPAPAGYDRVKALISLGLNDEARLELGAIKKRNPTSLRGSLEYASLYLAMADYSSAMSLFQRDILRQRDRDALQVWGVLYPAAYSELVARYSAGAGLDENLVYSLIRAESCFSPTARSPVGAMGLMQLMPATARATAKGMSENVTTSRLTRPELNIRIGTRHLRGLLTRFNGNLVSAVASYNAGATPVLRWRKQFAGLQEDEFIENIPYAETREYVKKVLAGIEIYRQLYGGNGSSPTPAQDISAGQPAVSSSQAN